jgi:hypothetical protein
MFCQSCITSIKAALKQALSRNQSHRSFGIVHDSLSDLYRSAEEGCWICRQIWQLMLEDEEHYTSRTGTSTEGESLLAVCSKIPSWLRKTKSSAVRSEMSSKDEYFCLDFKAIESCPSRHHGSLEVELHPSPNSRFGDALYMSLRTNNPESCPTTMNPGIRNQWMHTCSESHKKCRILDQELPPFVPDRLVEISTEDDGHTFTWRLVCHADISNDEYLTLSHCWGSSTHTSLTSKVALNI